MFFHLKNRSETDRKEGKYKKKKQGNIKRVVWNYSISASHKMLFFLILLQLLKLGETEIGQNFSSEYGEKGVMFRLPYQS